MYSSIRSLVICKYRDSNMFGNHFGMLNARMVQCGICDCCEFVVCQVSLGAPQLMWVVRLV